ncbi:ead/Ea22-like family protein [Salmonella enterica]|nr:ead/Ea22-like family protein [Salmonella enterica]EJE9711566.1 ead/Ea22-like family protein [Salmonella enterica]
MTALNKQALRSKARSASAGEWIKESGDGWEAICSSDDQANGNFIIAHFEGPDARANREFAQAANPAIVLALLDVLDAAEKRIAELRDWNAGLAQESFTYQQRVAELESRTVTVKLPADYRNSDGSINADMFNTCAVVGAFRDALAAAGIGVKGE